MVPVVFNVGFETAFPPEAASNQATVCPEVGVIASLASSVCIGEISHSVILPVEIGAAGAGFIVNVTAVLEYDGHVPSFDSA